MLKTLAVWLIAGTTVAIALTAGGSSAGAPSVPLTGIVSSQAEGPMEGVLVSVKAVGRGVTVTVSTDAKGRYSFPTDALGAGRYEVAVRAVGYEIENSDQRAVEIASGIPTQLDLRLTKARDLASQLTSAEWLLSVPGSQKQKEFLFRCTVCHTLTPIVKSKHDAVEFLAIMNRMRNYHPQSFLLRTYKLPKEVPSSAEAERLVRTVTGPGELMPRYGFSISRAPGQAEDAYAAHYLSSINLRSAEKWPFELKTLPRPKGTETRVVMTEYDLEGPEHQPHDAAVDPDGVVWHTDFALPFVGRLDPRTGKPEQFPVSMTKAKAGYGDVRGEGTGDVQIDRDGNPWFSFQSTLLKFDKNTHAFKSYQAPEIDGTRPGIGFFSIASDGRIVFLGPGVVFRLDPTTGEFTSARYSVPEGINGQFYGWTVDSKGTVYGALQWEGAIGEIDEKAGKMIVHRTPTPGSGPRRVHMDSQDRFWFAEYLVHKIAVLDTRTKKFQEWAVPTPWSGGYDVVPDKNGEVWGGGMHTDRIFRLNPKTGQVTEYLTPRELNVRRIEVDNSTTPVSVWVGNNHKAKLLKLQPLE